MSLDIGELVGYLKLDLGDWEANAAKAKAELAAVGNSSKDVDQVTASTTKASQGLKEVAGDAGTAAKSTKSVGDSSKDVDKVTKSTTQAGQGFKGMGEEADKARKKTEDTGESGSKSTKKLKDATDEAKTSLLGLGVGFGALPVMAAAAGAGVAGGLAGVPIIFGVIGARALASNAQVADSFGQLKSDVADDIQTMVAPMQGDVLQAIHDIGAAAEHEKPQLASLFAAGAPALLSLTHDVIGFSENALPNMVVALHSSEAPLQGLESLSRQTGAGVGEMFLNMSHGAQGAGQDLAVTGGIVRDFLGFTGSLFANLAQGTAGPLTQFRGALGQVEQIALTVTSTGMPLLQSTTGGFLSTISGGLGVVQLFASALGSWSAPIGRAGADLFTVNTIAQRFGTSLTQTGFGLSAFESKVDSAGNKTTPFKEALSSAEKEGTSKLKAGVGALIEGGINPLGLGLIAGSFLLDAFGRAQQQAAQAAAEHKENVRQLTEALNQDNGQIGEATRSVIAKALADKDAANNAQAAGLNMALYTDAAMGNAGAMRAVKTNTDDLITSILRNAGATDEQIGKFTAVNDKLLQTGGSANDATDAFGSLYSAQEYGAQALTSLTAEQENQLRAILNGTGAVGEQVKASKEAHDAYVLQEAALSGLTTAQVQNRDATETATKAIYDQVNAHLGYRGAVMSTKQAMDEYNAAVKSGNQDQVAQASLRLEQAMYAQEQAAYAAALADSKATTESGKVADAQAAANREAVNLANTFRGPMPASLQETISKMNVASAQAAGLTVEVDRTGAAVYRLPDGKTIRIEQQGAQAVRDAVEGLIRDENGRVITIHVRTDTGYVNVGVGTGGYHSMQAQGSVLMPGFAAGGIAAFAGGGLPTLSPMSPVAQVVPPNTWRVVGDNMTVPEAYIPLDRASSRSQAILDEANTRMGRGSGAATVVNNAPRVQVGAIHMSANASPADMADELDWYSRMGG